MPKISIIIPVYNSEKYISECIDSVLKQTYTNYDLILVIDGATDNSLEICRKYATIDERIIVIEKTNGGVSSARNVGMKKANGDYLMFLDSDDYIKKDMLSKMVTSAEENKPDIIFCGYEVNGSSLIFNDTQVLKKMGNNPSPTSIIESVISIEKERIYGYIWRNLFKKELLINNKIIFPEDIKMSEDFMFLVKVLSESKTVSIVPENLYVYRINADSATAKYLPSLHSDMVAVNHWMKVQIYPRYRTIIDGYYCCEANTYLRFIQNICRPGNPYSIFDRIKEAFKTKKHYKYRISLKRALKNWKKLSLKNNISYILLLLNLDWLYIILFSAKVLKTQNRNR